jgi:uncharacterized Zn finger protein
MSRFPPYVPVAKRRANAAKAMNALAKKGQTPSPVKIAGRSIASSFWGLSWCNNLERYSDYANRLPRGRTYVRNGSVVDLQIGKGEISARVSGSSLYTVKITISPLAAKRWTDLCSACTESFDSMVSLLAGKFDDAVMKKVCDPKSGLFPAPREIRFSCSCPDSASMCKHIAAVLYGVGARIDLDPMQLFVLRNVDPKEMIREAKPSNVFSKVAPKGSSAILETDDLDALFGFDLDDDAPPSTLSPQAKAIGPGEPVAPDRESDKKSRKKVAKKATQKGAKKVAKKSSVAKATEATSKKKPSKRMKRSESSNT